MGTLALLDLFSSHAWFFFATSFVVGTPENTLRTQFPLGLFLKASNLERGGPAAALRSKM